MQPREDRSFQASSFGAVLDIKRQVGIHPKS